MCKMKELTYSQNLIKHNSLKNRKEKTLSDYAYSDMDRRVGEIIETATERQITIAIAKMRFYIRNELYHTFF